MATELTIEQFVEILKDKDIIKQEDLSVFQIIYSREGHKTYASQVGKIMKIGGTRPASPINLQIGRLAKRIAKKYDIDFTTRKNQKYKYWDLFFKGEDHGNLFIWELTPNLIKALEETGLTVSHFAIDSKQNTFWFVWNPDEWEWKDLEQNIEELRNTGKVTLRWSCKAHKKIKIGDRIFLVKTGDNPNKGIMASGQIVSEPFLAQHWNDENKNAYYVFIEFDTIINPYKEPVMVLDVFRNQQNRRVQFTNSNKDPLAFRVVPRFSGFRIKPEWIDELEKQWFEFLSKNNKLTDYQSEPLLNNLTYSEGSPLRVEQTRYERNPQARKDCIKHHGVTCKVCEINFQKKYGELGQGFIHVHHLNYLSEAKGNQKTNPIEDLCPVCPNCHAMLHKGKLTIDALKKILVMNQK
ncbi:MAG: EVE domain-containing protein [Bacteroidales bacterium]|jgi:5-methylcytosine-specific restriction protein A|nr:EVE domain-containing protein [Bacteroidales bacterium]